MLPKQRAWLSLTTEDAVCVCVCITITDKMGFCIFGSRALGAEMAHQGELPGHTGQHLICLEHRGIFHVLETAYCFKKGSPDLAEVPLLSSPSLAGCLAVQFHRAL